MTDAGSAGMVRAGFGFGDAFLLLAEPKLTGMEEASWGLMEAAIRVVELEGLEGHPEAAAGLLAALRGILEGIGTGVGEGSDG